jgi:hypothetical protein
MNEKWTEDDKKYACPMNSKESFNYSYRDNMISSSTTATPTPDPTPEISQVKIWISVFSILSVIMILAIILLIVFLV